jgi:diamine N-acetyltransferase
MATFEKAEIKDIPIIQELAHRIWHQYYPGIISIAQIDYMLQMMYSSSTLSKELISEVMYELVMDCPVAQPVAISFLSYQYEKDRHRLKLNKLYLLPEYHGQGIGQLMLSHAEAAGEKCKAHQLYLTVNKNNDKAIKAYKKFGFTITESIVNDIGSGYVMDDFIVTYNLVD